MTALSDFRQSGEKRITANNVFSDVKLGDIIPKYVNSVTLSWIPLNANRKGAMINHGEDLDFAGVYFYSGSYCFLPKI